MKTQLMTQITAYLEGEVSLKQLVDWAEGMIANDFDAEQNLSLHKITYE